MHSRRSKQLFLSSPENLISLHPHTVVRYFVVNRSHSALGYGSKPLSARIQASHRNPGPVTSASPQKACSDIPSSSSQCRRALANYQKSYLPGGVNAFRRLGAGSVPGVPLYLRNTCLEVVQTPG